MLKEARFEQVYIVCGYTDMRRSIDGLAETTGQDQGTVLGGRWISATLQAAGQWLFSVAEERCRGKTTDSRAVYLAASGAFNRAAESN